MSGRRSSVTPESHIHRWPTFVVVLVALVYVVGIGVGWATNAADSYYGISKVDALLRDSNRLVIQAVEIGSPADRAGLRPGDVIVAVDGEERGVGSRARWAGTGNAPSFQTRPLAIPPGDAPLLRRTTGEGKPDESRLLRVARPSTGSSDAGSTTDVTMIVASRLASPEVVRALVTWNIVGLLTLLMGTVVILRRPSDIAARLLLAMASCFALALALLSWDNRPLSNDIAFLAQVLTVALLVVGSSALLHLWLAFPSPHKLLTRLGSLGPDALGPFGKATIGIYAVPLAVVLSVFIGPGSLWPWSYLIAIILIALAVLALGRSLLVPTSPLARAQLKCIALPLTVGLLALSFGPGVNIVTGAQSEGLDVNLVVASWALLPIGLAISVLRYRLFDVDLVLRAAMFYPLLVALLAGTYLASAQALGRVAVSLLGRTDVDNWSVSMLSALLVAAGAHPIYVRLQAGLDRLFYRQRLARQRLLEDTMALHSPVSPEDVASHLTEQVVNRLNLSKAWLVLPEGVTASQGVPASTLLLSREHLLRRMDKAIEPAFLSKDELAPGGPIAVLDDPQLEAWHAAGARLLLPLRGMSARAGAEGDGLLGVWLLGARRFGSLLDSEDVKAVARIARQAAVLLDNNRLHRREAVELERSARFRRYFSPQIADLIAAEGSELATHRRELTVLFAELRGFSALGEFVEPEELVHHLQEYVDAITAAVFERGGTLDRCLSEGVMAFFGDPLPQPDHAVRALQAAIAMQSRLEDLKRGWALGAAPVNLAIGLASGWVTAGTIGSPTRQEYGVVGHAVTLAARLAAAAGPGEVLLAEKTRLLIDYDIADAPRGEISVDGRSQVRVFALSAASRVSGDARIAPPPIHYPARNEGSEAETGTTENADLLGGTTLFATLPTRELRALASHLRAKHFKKGAVILGGHERSVSFFLIKSGTVKVSRTLATGDEAVIDILGPGEFFGELALLEGQPDTSPVVALQPTEILALSRDVFLGCLQAYPSAANAAIALLSERIRRLNDRLEEAHSLELPQRLARRLLTLGSIHGKQTKEGLVIDLSLTQSELAGMVGASRQRVNRILAGWQDRQLLRLGSYGRITLLSPDSLTDLSPESLVG